MIRGAWENACMRGGADLHVRELATLQDCSFAVCDFRGNWQRRNGTATPMVSYGKRRIEYIFRGKGGNKERYFKIKLE